MDEWPRVIEWEQGNYRPVGVKPPMGMVTVVPAEWYEKRTDLARELYEAMNDYADGPDPDTFPDLEKRWKRVLDALARYEQEVGE